jgi:hypothetical protein
MADSCRALIPSPSSFALLSEHQPLDISRHILHEICLSQRQTSHLKYFLTSGSRLYGHAHPISISSFLSLPASLPYQHFSALKLASCNCDFAHKVRSIEAINNCSSTAMQLHISSHTLLLLSSLFFSSSALPFLPRLQVAQPEPILIPRASYSVVPVDGGDPTAAAGGPVGATTTVTETIVQTAPAPAPTTVTVISTAAVPSDTETVTSVVTVVEHTVVQTSIVTVTPAPAPVAITASGEQTMTNESKTSLETTPSADSYPSLTPVISIPLAFTSSSDPSPCTTESATQSTITPSSTSDDGLWHTTYPPWSNSTSATALAIKPRHTTTLL